jgi:hypothetical protein
MGADERPHTMVDERWRWSERPVRAELELRKRAFPWTSRERFPLAPTGWQRPERTAPSTAVPRIFADTEEVTGSNPVAPTIPALTSGNAAGLFPSHGPQRPREHFTVLGSGLRRGISASATVPPTSTFAAVSPCRGGMRGRRAVGERLTGRPADHRLCRTVVCAPDARGRRAEARSSAPAGRRPALGDVEDVPNVVAVGLTGQVLAPSLGS